MAHELHKPMYEALYLDLQFKTFKIEFKVFKNLQLQDFKKLKKILCFVYIFVYMFIGSCESVGSQPSARNSNVNNVSRPILTP